MKFHLTRLFIFSIIILTASCVPVKKLRYFNDINEMAEPVINPRMQKIIMPFDRIYVRVLSIDPQTSQIFNATDEMRMSSYGSGSSLLGYLVDETGNIYFPFVGDINVGGLTTSLAGEKIQKALSDYVGQTSVSVKYVDNQVTIVGEVNRQGIFSFTQDKLNIYEAIGLGGGLSRYGDRKNVILMRHEGEKIMHYKLNLSDSKIASRDYYYIMPNDVIVVEPLKTVSSSYSNITYTTILTSITTLISILVTIVSLNNL